MLGIWGAIGYKIYTGTRPEPLAELPEVMPGQATALAASQDTFELHANYSDPFLERGLIKQRAAFSSPASPQPQAQRPAAQQRPTPAKPKAPVQWPNISWLGYQHNTNTGDKLVILKVNDQETVMRAGDIVLDMELLAINPDSIVLRYKEEEKSIAQN